MKTVMNHSHDGWLLKMISRTDPVIKTFFKKTLEFLIGDNKSDCKMLLEIRDLKLSL